MDDWHATKLVDHVLNTIGRILLVTTGILFFGGLVVGASGEPGLYGLVGVAAAVVAGAMFWISQAPAPSEADVSD